MNSLLEKEKQLENLLIFALKNFAPNFIVKNSDLKYFENILPDGNQGTESALGNLGNITSNNTNPILLNNQLIEINKSTYQKNDVLNKIFKEIKQNI